MASLSATSFNTYLMPVVCACADARTLSAAAYAPYNAKQEAAETPAYKAEAGSLYLL